MKRVLTGIVLVAAVVGLAAAAGVQQETTVRDRYPDTVDPFGAYDPPVTVRMAKEVNAALNHPDGWDWQNNVWYDAIAEELGIILVNQFEALDLDDYNTRMNLAIASNDVPDIMYLPRSSMFNRLLGANRLEDITEAYEKFAYPLFKEFYESDGGVRKGWGTVEGRIMGLSRDGLNYQTPRVVYIRQDWREELGLAAPETMEDVIGIAEAFKAVDPQNRFGILMNNQISTSGFADMTGIANSMGVYPRKWIVGDDGRITYGSIQPEMRDVIELYRDFYRDGMIHPEFATMDGGATPPQILNGQVGVIVGAPWVITWPLPQLWQTEGVNWEIYPVMPMTGESDSARVQLDNIERRMHAVRRGFAHPEALIKIMNFQIAMLNDPDRAQTERFHSDDEYTYHMYQPVYPAYSPIFLNLDTQVNVTAAVRNGFDESYLQTPHDRSQFAPVKEYFEVIEAGEKPSNAQWVRYHQWYGDRSVFGVLNHYRFNDLHMISPVEGVVTEEMSRFTGALQQIEDEYIIQMITGTRPLGDFDEFVERWNGLGGRTIIDELNDWYDAQ